MSTTSPILLLSRSTMTRPRQPRAVPMLRVAMLASFLVGYLSRLLGAVALHVTDASSQSSFPPRQIPVVRQTSGARLDLSYSCSGRGWLEALPGSDHRWTGISRHLPTVAQSCRRPRVTNGPAATRQSPALNDDCVHSSC